MSTATVSATREYLRTQTKLPEELLRTAKEIGIEAQESFSVGGGVGPYNEVLYVLARLLRPSTVVETGVAYGFSSSYILQALRDNCLGHLYSIDSPNTDPTGFVDADGHVDVVYTRSVTDVGRLVPQELRERWTLIPGTSREQLAHVLQQRGHIDLFFHDSDHSYSNMTWEFRAVWPFLRTGGVLVSDDISRHSAFDDFIHQTDSRAIRWFGKQRGRQGAAMKL